MKENNFTLDDIGKADDNNNFYKDGFPIFCDDNFEKQESFKDELHLLCERFILESELPDDTDPSSIRARVWRVISLKQRIILTFKRIRP